MMSATHRSDGERRALYELILGHEPDLSSAECPARARPPEIAAALLASQEFQVSIAEPALDGTLAGLTDPVSDEVGCWVQRLFALPHVAEEPRLALLARVLESAALAPIVASLPVVWSPTGLADALRASLPVAAGLWEFRSNAAIAVARIGRGVRIHNVSGLMVGDYPQQILLDAGARWILFSPSFDQLPSAEFCRVDFGLISEIDGGTTLFVDYGEGFQQAQSLPLLPRGRARYSAFLADPAKIRALRWDLADAGNTVRLTMLTARAVGADEIARRTMAVAGEPGLEWLGGRRLPNLRPTSSEPNAFRLSRALTRALGGNEGQHRYTYPDWLADNELSGPASEAKARRDTALLRKRPEIELIVIVEGLDPRRLRQTVESLRTQFYPEWRAQIAQVSAAADPLRPAATHHSEPDDRIVVAAEAGTDSLSAILNSALAQAKGAWIGILRSGDVLRPDALLRFAQAIQEAPDAGLIFADHDYLDREGVRRKPQFKPDYAPETLLGYDYLDGPTLLRADAIRAVGGWAVDPAGAEQYDLVLRVIEGLDAGMVRHLPEVLCHRRQSAQPDGQAVDAAVVAVRNHLARRGSDLDVMPLTGTPGRRLRPRLPATRPLVSLIIPTRDRSDLLDACVASILSRTSYEPYEIIVVDNGSVEPETHALFAAWRDEPRIRVLSHPGPFNYAAINNAGVAQATGEVVALVNNDIEVISPDWLDELVGWAIQPEIGCVGAKLLFPDGTIQHGGIVLGIGGVAAHAHKYAPRDSQGYVGRLARVHNVSAVTGACLVVRRQIYEALGGLDDALAVAYNEVDFCLRVLDVGYRNLFTPFAKLYHHESKSRGADDSPEKQARLAAEAEAMKVRWGDCLCVDPFYSPNLSRIHEDFSFYEPSPAWGWKT